jgi:hypothetical protein
MCPWHTPSIRVSKLHWTNPCKRRYHSQPPSPPKGIYLACTLRAQQCPRWAVIQYIPRRKSTFSKTRWTNGWLVQSTCRSSKSVSSTKHINWYSAVHTAGAYLPENFIQSFFDMVIWGHEHECLIDPIYNAEQGFYVVQPGSSVATSLSQGETVPKYHFSSVYH